jgi:hypothetical protein
VPDIKTFARSIEAAWAAGDAAFKERFKRESVLSQAPDLLPLYRYINEPEHLPVLAELNVSAALRARSASHDDSRHAGADRRLQKTGQRVRIKHPAMIDMPAYTAFNQEDHHVCSNSEKIRHRNGVPRRGPLL